MAERPITGHLELLYPSEYVKAADLKGKDVTVAIDFLTWENLVMAGGKKDRKVTVHLRSVGGKPLEKRWVVGKTVLRQIAAALGGETDVAKWGGGKITMWPTTCRGGDGRTVECIRVRVRTNERATEISEEMAATPAPRSSFADEAADDEKPPSEPPPVRGTGTALDFKDWIADAKSEAEIVTIAGEYEAARAAKKFTGAEVAQLKKLLDARREALAGVVAPTAEPPVST